MPWIDQNGEIGDCPVCGGTDVQVAAMERERRADRAARTRAERALDHDTVKARDGATWKRILAAYKQAFPGKKLSATSIKSARATAVFQRLERGATEQDWLDVIRGGQEFPYVVFGKRQRSGSRSDLADDLQHLAAINRDHEFEFLLERGRTLREGDQGE